MMSRIFNRCRFLLPLAALFCAGIDFVEADSILYRCNTQRCTPSGVIAAADTYRSINTSLFAPHEGAIAGDISPAVSYESKEFMSSNRGRPVNLTCIYPSEDLEATAFETFTVEWDRAATYGIDVLNEMLEIVQRRDSDDTREILRAADHYCDLLLEELREKSSLTVSFDSSEVPGCPPPSQIKDPRIINASFGDDVPYCFESDCLILREVFKEPTPTPTFTPTPIVKPEEPVVPQNPNDSAPVSTPTPTPKSDNATPTPTSTPTPTPKTDADPVLVKNPCGCWRQLADGKWAACKPVLFGDEGESKDCTPGEETPEKAICAHGKWPKVEIDDCKYGADDQCVLGKGSETVVPLERDICRRQDAENCNPVKAQGGYPVYRCNRCQGIEKYYPEGSSSWDGRFKWYVRCDNKLQGNEVSEYTFKCEKYVLQASGYKPGSDGYIRRNTCAPILKGGAVWDPLGNYTFSNLELDTDGKIQCNGTCQDVTLRWDREEKRCVGTDNMAVCRTDPRVE